MRFLVDRCAGARLAQWSRDQGHDTVEAAQLGDDPGDAAILQRAADDDRILVTIAGKTYQVEHYNLDVIISVGYRVKSAQGTRFRQWATRTLRDHLGRGYTINRRRFEANARELEAALALVRKAAAGEALSTDQGRGLVDVIARYTQTFLLLQRCRA